MPVERPLTMFSFIRRTPPHMLVVGLYMLLIAFAMVVIAHPV